MSSVDATADDTVVMATPVRENDARRAVTVVAALAFAQVVWLVLLVFGAIWLLT